MGMQLGINSGRHGGRRAFRPNSDINVTPMVDVMLVLLVVFMVTAPLMTVGVPVDLPKSKASTLAAEKEPLYVTIKTDGRVFVQETEVNAATMIKMLSSISEGNPDVRILIRGDKSVSYGRMMEVMGNINAAGFKKLALVAQSQE